MNAEQLIRSIEQHDIDQMLSLLKQGVSPNSGLPDHPRALPLHVAVEEVADGFSTESVALLLRYGAYPDGNSNETASTPLILAVKHNLPEVVLLLLAAGADPNFIDEEGASPIGSAVELNRPAIVSFLLHFGAAERIDSFRTYGGTTLLGLAVSKLNIPIIQLLLAAGANPLEQDDYQQIAIEHLPPRNTNPETLDVVTQLLNTSFSNTKKA
jgi:ankyrin repeat protein